MPSSAHRSTCPNECRYGPYRGRGSEWRRPACEHSLVNNLSFVVADNDGNVELIPVVDGVSLTQLVGDYESAHVRRSRTPHPLHRPERLAVCRCQAARQLGATTSLISLTRRIAGPISDIM